MVNNFTFHLTVTHGRVEPALSYVVSLDSWRESKITLKRHVPGQLATAGDVRSSFFSAALSFFFSIPGALQQQQPTDPFSILEPPDQVIGEFHVVQERRATDFVEPKSRKSRSGSKFTSASDAFFCFFSPITTNGEKKLRWFERPGKCVSVNLSFRGLLPR